MRHYCFCCGSRLAVAVDVPHPRCYACTQGCAVVAPEKVLRGSNCPFILRRGSAGSVMADVPRPPRAVGTKLEGDSFEWRGRVRRNVPGG